MSRRNLLAHKTIIAWLIKQLRQLPTTRQAFFKLAAACYSLTFIFLIITLLGDSVSKLEIIIAIVLPLIILIIVGAGAWLRKRIDQRFSPSVNRNKMLNRLARTVTSPHPTNADEYIFKRFRPRSTEPYHFPPADNEKLIAEAAKLDCAVFLGSAYEDSLESKLHRNHTHQSKNPFSVMLVSLNDKTSGTLKFIGFTHLIPVSEATYDQYLNGKITDKDFNAGLVCKPHEPAFAVIIFSLGLERYRLKEVFKNNNRGKFDMLLSNIGLPPIGANDMYEAEFNLWVGLIYHLRQLLDNQKTAQWPTRILAPSFNKKVMRILEGAGFKKRPETSANGESLFELKLSLNDNNT